MKRNIIHDGVSIKIFETDDPQKVIIHFTDEITAFNKIKKAVIKDKGISATGFHARSPDCCRKVECLRISSSRSLTLSSFAGNHR